MKIYTISFLMLLFSGKALADTYIFVTNTTPDTVTVSVSHYGSDILVEGDEWEQEATEIPPYATRRVLRFNRYWGVKSGHYYYFDTSVSSATSSVVLQQKMKGTWSGSDIWHSAMASDFDAPWYYDRNIHTFSTQYESRDSVASFKAEYTGSYDDFYYTVHNNTDTEQVSGADAFKVLTYNIWALPLVASKIGERLAEIPAHIQGYDAVLIQEAFSSDRDDMLLALAAEYPYQTHIPGTGENTYDSGTLIISRYPIVAVADFIFPDCTGTDCYADKAVIYAEIIKEGKAYHVTATHTASFDTDEARALRQEQFQQIRALVDAQSIPSSDAVLMGGDFNVNKFIWPQDYLDMLANLNATDPVSTGYEATFDPRVNENAGASGSGGTAVEYLDYVVYANDHRQPAVSRNDVRVLRSVAEPVWGMWDLSDHFPVLGEFEFLP